jgi:glycosyltransferase involved in cell wall biosynthesis
MSRAFRVAVASWSSRRVGGIEDYLSLVIPGLHSAGLETAFWHESDEPVNRPRITIPKAVADICAAKSGTDSALAALRDWAPDVIFVQGMLDAGVERHLMDLAPAVRFLHTYSGTCISGGKTFTRPVVNACDRKYGWPCLLHYFPHGCGGRSPVTMWRQFQRQNDQLATLRRYTSILTHTTHMQNELSKHGMSATILPFPVEQPNGGSAGLQPCQSLPASSFTGEVWRLLFAARMDFLKGGMFLLNALPMVAAIAQRPVTITLAGDGPERAALESRAREIAAPNITTHFTGWVAQEYVGALMRVSDLLVVPSLWPEPLGSIGPAAAHYGLPAAAYSVGGIRDWLTDAVNGHFAPAHPPTPQGLAKAIVRCLEDPRHYDSLRTGAREMSSRFTITSHLPGLIASLEQAAGRTGPIERVGPAGQR